MASLTPFIDLARELLQTYEPRQLHAPHLREAGVLLLLYHDRGADRVLLTRRTDTVDTHKGQISFPGGGRHNADHDLGMTALRETWEEVGVHPDHVELLGRLDDIITISDFLVAPYVGLLHRTPYEFVPQETEVAELLEVPVPHLLDEANLIREARTYNGVPSTSPAYLWGEHRIWGATARMLYEFLELLRLAPDRLAAALPQSRS